MSVGGLVAVDVGTHTILAAAGRLEGGRLVVAEDRQWFARLGEGVRASGLLRPEAIDRALRALREVRAMAEARGVAVAAVATRACREAGNRDQFVRAAEEALGAPLEIVPGEREAELAFRGARSGLDVRGAAAFVDVGGGSTEVIDADDGRMAASVSLPLGAVALTEEWFRGDPYAPEDVDRAREAIRSVLARVPFAMRGTVVGIGGTATTFAAMELGLGDYDGSRVHGLSVSRGAMAERIARLAAMRAAERRGVRGLAPQRADVIVAGGLVLLAILDLAGAAALTVSDRGVRHGLLLDRLGASG